jgi:hypothetical protein
VYAVVDINVISENNMQENNKKVFFTGIPFMPECIAKSPRG